MVDWIVILFAMETLEDPGNIVLYQTGVPKTLMPNGKCRQIDVPSPNYFGHLLRLILAWLILIKKLKIKLIIIYC